MIKALIIEDEEPARELLKNYLADYSDIEIIGEISDGFNGAKAINELLPDLVFLDVQMPKLTGFEVLEIIEHKPIIVFSTAFDQFAIKAFEMNALDYLLKPFSRERFKQAIEKVFEKFNNRNVDAEKVNNLITSVSEKQEILERVAVRSGRKIHIIPSENIFYIEADGDYVMIHTEDGKYLKEKTLRYFESHLDAKLFIRVHRSFLVNIRFIDQLELYEKENYSVRLKNNELIKASSSGYKLLRQVLNL